MYTLLAASNTDSVEMNVDDIERVIKESARCGFKEVVITDGEPLMHNDRDILIKRFVHIRQEIKSIKIILRTNLTMKTTLKDLFVVSVDGGKINMIYVEVKVHMKNLSRTWSCL